MSSRVLVRVVTAALLGSLCGVLAAVAVVVLGEPVRTPLARPDVARSVPPPGPPGDRPREVLRSWDAAREAAWAAGDAGALARLYTPASVAGARDVAMLRAWTARGQRVTAMTTQVLALDVVDTGGGRLVVDVTDRLARVEARGLRLPADRVSRRRLVLHRDGTGEWRVASVVSRRLRPGRSAGTPRRRGRQRSNPSRAGPPGAR